MHRASAYPQRSIPALKIHRVLYTVTYPLLRIFVFEINEDDDCLEIVDDFDLAEKVFEEYYKLLDEEE